MSRAYTLLALALYASACDSSPLQSVDSKLRVEPGSLIFPDTFVGFPSRLTLRVQHTGRSTRQVDLRLESPFRVEDTDRSVPAGAGLELNVAFDPSAPGSASSVLRLGSDGEELVVPLKGTGLAVPTCAASSVCQTVAFDPATGQCVESPKMDGIPCSSACIDDGHCYTGACLGATPTRCDDHNACTLDACEALRGCFHLDQSAECTAPNNSCRAPYCDPATGCALAEVADGISCGPADCSSADICLNGACQTVAVPDGASCQLSPCRLAGSCQNNLCVQPSPTTRLEPVWSYWVPKGSDLSFPGVLDAAGSLYWLECDTLPANLGTPSPQRCELVSVTRDGALRYRKTQANGASFGAQAQGSMLLVGELLVLVNGLDVVEVRSQKDGALAWSRDLLRDVRADFKTALSLPHVALIRAVDSGAGNLVILVNHAVSNSAGEGCWALSLAASSGALLWKRHFDQRCQDALIGDETGNLYLCLFAGGLGPKLVSLSPSGRVRWQQQEGRVPLAAHEGRVFLIGSLVRSAATGEELYRVTPNETPGSFYLSARDRDHASPLLTRTNGTFFELAGNGVILRGFDSVAGTAGFGVDLGSPSNLTQPILTRSGSTLFTAGCCGYSTLNAVSASGERSFTCPLSKLAGEYRGPVALHQGRWFGVTGGKRVDAYDLPGIELAQRWWVTSGGTMAKTGRPR